MAMHEEPDRSPPPRARPLRLRLLGVAALVAAVALPSSARAQPIDPSAPVRDPDSEAPRDPDAGGPLVAPRATSTVPAELALPASPEAARAQSLSAVRRFAEAAAAFDALAEQTQDPRFLFHAALAWTGAGRHGAAALDLQRLLERVGLSQPVRADVEARIADAQARSIAVHMRLHPGPVGTTDPPLGRLASAPIRVEAVDTGMVTQTTSATIYLDPGAYEVTVAAEGYRPLRRRLLLPATGQAEATWDLYLEPIRVVVDLRIRPEKALRGRAKRRSLQLTRSGGDAMMVVTRDDIGASETVVLTPATWNLRVETPHYTTDRNVHITEQTRNLDVYLSKRSESAPRFVRRRKALLTAGIYTATTYVAGIGLILGGTARQNNAVERYEEALSDLGVDPESDAPLDDATLAAANALVPTVEYHDRLRSASSLQTAGVVTAMSGIGALVAAIPAFTGSRRRFGYINFGVGAAMLGGGVGWMVLYARRSDALFAPRDPAERVTKDELSGLVGPRLGAGTLLGIGGGLFVESALVLLIDRRRRLQGYAAAPLFGPGLAGASLQGRF
ncbi:MAG: hypothetical protein R3A79_21375 [Nannocystaceae bacterium]